MDEVYDVGTDGGDFVILILMFVTAKIYFDEIKKEIETEQKISEEKELENENKPLSYGTLG